RKLEVLLGQVSTSAEDSALFTELLSLPNDCHPRSALSPQERRKRTIDALDRRLEALAAQQPVLLVFEDVHWIDPTSLEVLNRMVEQIGNLRVLLVATFRPEFASPWAGLANVSTVTLNRLPQSDCCDLVRHVVTSAVISTQLVDEIVARTDGVPLFLE